MAIEAINIATRGYISNLSYPRAAIVTYGYFNKQIKILIVTPYPLTVVLSYVPEYIITDSYTSEFIITMTRG